MMLSIYLAMLDDDGDKRRFETLYHKYRDAMITYAFSMLNNQDAAIDAVDSALYAIAKNIKSLPCDSDTTLEKAYIYKVLKNAALNEAKKLKRTVNIDYYAEEFEFVDHTTPADTLISYETLKKLTDYIKKMPDEYRDTLTLRYLHNLSCSEISVALGISINTVKSRVRRGTSMLHEKLG